MIVKNPTLLFLFTVLVTCFGITGCGGNTETNLDASQEVIPADDPAMNSEVPSGD